MYMVVWIKLYANKKPFFFPWRLNLPLSSTILNFESQIYNDNSKNFAPVIFHKLAAPTTKCKQCSYK